MLIPIHFQLEALAKTPKFLELVQNLLDANVVYVTERSRDKEHQKVNSDGISESHIALVRKMEAENKLIGYVQYKTGAPCTCSWAERQEALEIYLSTPRH